MEPFGIYSGCQYSLDRSHRCHKRNKLDLWKSKIKNISWSFNIKRKFFHLYAKNTTKNLFLPEQTFKWKDNKINKPIILGFIELMFNYFICERTNETSKIEYKTLSMHDKILSYFCLQIFKIMNNSNARRIIASFLYDTINSHVIQQSDNPH